jgi:hypothetical protein
MLDLNPGLKDISHSITGGALTAQGKSKPPFTFFSFPKSTTANAYFIVDFQPTQHLTLYISLLFTYASPFQPHEAEMLILFAHRILDALRVRPRSVRHLLP